MNQEEIVELIKNLNKIQIEVIKEIMKTIIENKK
ncbi:Uncharacterised protein [[Clostridium] sordellii]|nr:Uncharacterised protein [[Clostridium] sordellii] [Paeniclostridium sordellii]CEQ19696.1 Uncharacterised protein [[Clostridium] sordellii] [Paeniclostridium sordellii]